MSYMNSVTRFGSLWPANANVPYIVILLLSSACLTLSCRDDDSMSSEVCPPIGFGPLPLTMTLEPVYEARVDGSCLTIEGAVGGGMFDPAPAVLMLNPDSASGVGDTVTLGLVNTIVDPAEAIRSVTVRASLPENSSSVSVIRVVSYPSDTLTIML